MGFAIPAQIAKPTVDTLIREGKVRHAYMGVGITDVTPENARFFHVNDNIGAVISQVESDSPGEKAGLHVGDVIIVEGTRAKDGGTHGNARSVFMASTGKKLGAGSSEGVTP